MNLDGLLSIVLGNINTPQQGEIPIQGSLNLSDFIEQGINIKTGQILQISFDNSHSLINISSENKNNSVSLPISVFDIEHNLLSTDRTTTVEAKVSSFHNHIAKLQLIKINNQSPQQYLKEQAAIQQTFSEHSGTTIIKDTGRLQQVSLTEIDIADIAKQKISSLPLPENIKIELTNTLQTVKIQFQLANLSSDIVPQIQTTQQLTNPVVINNSITAQINSKINTLINEVPSQLSSNAQDIKPIITEITQNICNSLQEFIGTKIPAITLENTEFKTAFGQIRAEVPFPVVENLPAELKIVDIILQPNSLIPPKETPHLNTITQIIEPLKQEAPYVYEMIISKLPSNNDNMLKNMVLFTKAAIKADISQWLGQEIIHELETGSQQSRQILSEFQHMLQESNRSIPSWRIIEIPYYIENHINKIRLAIKQYPDEADNEEARDKFGTRFVVDTNFSILGAFQFDGFSFAKEKRFDLIIRTELEIGDDLYANIMKIFKTSLNDVGYIGNLNINLKENFIKISEDDDREKFLSQDLFV